MCANCTDNRRRHAHLLRAPRAGGGSTMPGPRPTAAGLERHARRFGPAQVAETAAQYGLSVALERPHGARRVSRPGLKARVAALVRDGHDADTVAEVENLSPARARRLVDEVRA